MSADTAAKPEVKRESRTSFVYQPNNNRMNDHIKMQRLLGETYLFPFTFVIVADSQIGMKSNTGSVFAKCIEKINNLNPKPKFFVLLGDICDSPPTGNNEYALRRQQEKDFFAAIDTLNSDIYFIPISGEHDVGNQPNHSTLTRYRLSYGPEYYDFNVAGIKFIVLTSQYYVDRTHVVDPAEDQEQFLEGKLVEAGGPFGPIVFMHTPPFEKTADESDSKYVIKKVFRGKLLQKLLKGGVKYLFCGHLHRNALARFNTMDIISTASIGDPRGGDKPGFRVVTLHENKLQHDYVTIET